MPSGWEIQNLGELVRFTSGGTPSKEREDYWNGDIPWITAKDLKSFEIKTSIDKVTKEGSLNGTRTAKSGSILILVRGMTLLKDIPIGFLTGDVAFNQDVKNLEPDNQLDGRYLAYALAGSKHQLLELVTVAGHGTGKLETESLKSFPILFPPLPEQIQIAASLSAWDDSLLILARLIDTKRQQKRALAEQLLPGKRRLKGFEGEWVEQTLASYLEESRIGGTDGAKARKITVKLWGKGVYEKNEKLLGSENTRYFKRRAGQFIFSKLDFLNGAFGIVPEHLDGLESTLDLPCFDFSTGLDPKFFLEFASRESFYSRFEDGAIGGRKARRVTPEEFLKSQIFLPPLAEQQAIAAVLSALDAEIDLLVRQQAKVQEQKRGLMDLLLTGKVRVQVLDDGAA